MKSPTLLRTVDALDFNLLKRNSAIDESQQVQTKRFRRRASRKNLLILTIVYAVCLACILALVF